MRKTVSWVNRWLSAGLDVLTYLLTYSRIRTC